MTTAAAGLEVVRDDAASRFEGRLAGELVGVVDYLWSDGTLTVTHTGTEPRWRGRGIAAQLTRAALDDVRARGERVRPVCPYTRHFLAEHPEYADLVSD